MIKLTRDNSLSISEIEDRIDKVYTLAEEELNLSKVEDSSIIHVLMDILISIMYIVEKLFSKDTSGYLKKIIVVEVGEKIIQKFCPSYLEYYNREVDNIIENLIKSYKLLKEHKKFLKTTCVNTKMSSCLPFCCLQ